MMVVTLVTAALCGLLYVWLSWRVVQVRQSAKVSLGDGGDGLLLQRIRAHANFAEYVPICLVLIFAIENSLEISPPVLWAAGLGLFAVRVAHAVGMGIDGANPWRVIGTAGTWTILAGLSLWALVFAVRLVMQ
jgi:uncharacterized membrane protein YecN with MAPEG domain